MYFCNVKEHIAIDDKELKRYEPHRFKMLVSSKEGKVKFAGGALTKMSFQFEQFFKDNDWYAKGPYQLVEFEGRRLSYASITSDITAFSAECDKF